MKKTILTASCAFLVAALPALAGQLQGNVTATGMRDNADAVVYVDSIPGKSFAAPDKPVEMDQVNMQFSPHVLPVLIGTTVTFKNSDPFAHNVFTPSKCAGSFNLGSWGQGQSKNQTFSKACVAVLLCNIHPEMEGYVLALPTPYFATTDASGHYVIDGVPDGTYTVKAWHARLKESSSKVTVSGDTTANFTLHK